MFALQQLLLTGIMASAHSPCSLWRAFTLSSSLDILTKSPTSRVCCCCCSSLDAVVVNTPPTAPLGESLPPLSVSLSWCSLGWYEGGASSALLSTPGNSLARFRTAGLKVHLNVQFQQNCTPHLYIRLHFLEWPGCNASPLIIPISNYVNTNHIANYYEGVET